MIARFFYMQRALIFFSCFFPFILYPMLNRRSPKPKIEYDGRGAVVSDSLSHRKNSFQVQPGKIRQVMSYFDISSIDQSESIEFGIPSGSELQKSDDYFNLKDMIEGCEHLRGNCFSNFYLIVLKSEDRIAYKICCNKICCQAKFKEMLDALIKENFKEIKETENYLGIVFGESCIIKLQNPQGIAIELFCKYNKSFWSGSLNEPTSEIFPNSVILDRPNLWKTTI